MKMNTDLEERFVNFRVNRDAIHKRTLSHRPIRLKHISNVLYIISTDFHLPNFIIPQQIFSKLAFHSDTLLYI